MRPREVNLELMWLRRAVVSPARAAMPSKGTTLVVAVWLLAGEDTLIDEGDGQETVGNEHVFKQLRGAHFDFYS